MPVPDRLKHARERSGLTLSQVKERTGIGESSLSDFENAKREPSLSQLDSLAEVYRRPMAFFLAEGPVPEEVVLWRQRPETGVQEIEAAFLQLCERYHNLEVWTRQTRPLCLPEVKGNQADASYSYANAEALAKKVRDDLNLGDRPALALLSVLEEVCGVKVFHVDFDSPGTAASSQSDSFGASVLLNRANKRWRRNFDLAHELFHLLTWPIFRRNLSPGDSSASPDPKEESFANCFAANLLMPAEVLRVAVHDKTPKGRFACEDLFDVARQFDVSTEAMVWRMAFVGLLEGSKEDHERFIERAQALASILEERDDTRAPALPERYRALATKALRRGEISTGRFAEYMGISRQDAMKYVEQETSEDEEIPVTPA